jgi:hypothetical protein
MCGIAGFVRFDGNGVGPEDLGQAAKDPGAPEDLHLVHVKKVVGKEAALVLPTVIGSALRALPFPKRMNWDAWLEDGKGAFPFQPSDRGDALDTAGPPDDELAVHRTQLFDADAARSRSNTLGGDQ